MKRTVTSVGALTLAVALVGCGSSSSKGGTPGVDAFALVAGTADKTAAAKNAKVSLDLVIDTTTRTVTEHGDGVADFAGKLFKLSIPLPDGSPASGSIDELFVNRKLYLRLPAGLRYKTAGKEWVVIDPSKLTGPSSSNFGDLTSNLTALKSVSSDVKDLGPADVRGAHTTHYLGQVDLEKAAKLRGIRAASLNSYRELLGRNSTMLPEDVYIDDEGRARRVSITIRPQAGSPAASSLKSEYISIEFYDFGQADTSGITAPSADQTVDASDVPGLLSSLGG